MIMGTESEYSLWLMPTGNVYEHLASIIVRLGKQYSAPYFEPHVTLLGKLVGSENEILSETAQLATLVRPYLVLLGRVDYLDEYFRCLFIRAEETEQVMGANGRARLVFDRHQDPRYMPHLSLMYGNFAPAVKEQIIAKIGSQFDLRFQVQSIHLFSTNGEPKNWYRVKEFTLE
jgi:2'-5' RNA ligase